LLCFSFFFPPCRNVFFLVAATDGCSSFLFTLFA
jgi:hypothetical protein